MQAVVPWSALVHYLDRLPPPECREGRLPNQAEVVGGWVEVGLEADCGGLEGLVDIVDSVKLAVVVKECLEAELAVDFASWEGAVVVSTEGSTWTRDRENMTGETC